MIHTYPTHLSPTYLPLALQNPKYKSPLFLRSAPPLHHFTCEFYKEDGSSLHDFLSSSDFLDSNSEEDDDEAT